MNEKASFRLEHGCPSLIYPKKKLYYMQFNFTIKLIKLEQDGYKYNQMVDTLMDAQQWKAEANTYRFHKRH